MGAGLAGALGSTLPGCALVPAGAPSLAPSPSGTPLPGQSALLTLRTALESAIAQPWPDAHAALLTWALGVTADQCVAVSLPAPTPAVTPSAQRVEAPDAAATTTLVAALVAAREAFRTQALADTAAHPLLWASMTAWAGVTAAQIGAPDARVEPARGVFDPPQQTAAEAVQAALDAAGQAIHGIELAAGTVGLSVPEVASARGRITAWFGVRDALLAALGPTPTPTPSPAQPWYEVERPADPTEARALIARLEAAALPILGRSFAYGPTTLRAPLVDALVDAAADVPRWGGLAERWPGLPIS